MGAGDAFLRIQSMLLYILVNILTEHFLRIKKNSIQAILSVVQLRLFIFIFMLAIDKV